MQDFNNSMCPAFGKKMYKILCGTGARDLQGQS